MATRGQVEYEDYLRQCAAKNEKPQVFICHRCDHPLKKEDDPCPQCDGSKVSHR